MRPHTLAPALCLAIALLAAAAPAPIPVTIPAGRKEPVSYTKDVAEILGGKCVGCHSAALAENKLNLEDVPAMLKGGKRGAALVPGKADQSLLFTMSAHRVEPVMPPKDKRDAPPLSTTELGLLKLWIDAGAKDDSAENAEAATPVQLGALPPGVHPINAVDLTADGTLVVCGRANVVQVYDVASGREIVTLGGHKDLIQSVRFSPDGRRLAAGSYQVVTVWNVPTGGGQWSEMKPLGPHADRVLALDFNPDGTILAAGGGEPSRSGEIKIWEVGKGLLVRTLEGLHSDTVFGLRFSPDGSKLASAGADKFLKVSRTSDGKELKSFEGHANHVLAVDWSADGKQIVTGGADNVLKVWDADSGEQVRTLPGAGKQVTSVRWLPGKPDVAGASGDKLVRFWNAGSGGVSRTFAGPGDYVYAVAAS